MGASELKPAGVPIQLDLFDSVKKNDKSWENVDRRVESITTKFGRDAIKWAALND